ncbi:hypothetical protein PV10_00188 [Exophiala mesophila]|uniref:Uncharacterized protein n=1 Tax=Exophiala mesophila TaxID=212818 RepID=A0A0D1Y6G8_EXOME|nr:uncharacterized protein PV10_00188 [Exophiala mesophila]KIV96306.1 hypothetical protein PV10_00188 [Exophiala mesophila]
MDSMRSLNTSLPSSSSASRQPPPEQLLQAFRSAALSVTNLYKSAVTDQAKSRQAGYQEALEDLLGFLDRENLGLQDGEGWRVRQWATERYDGSSHQQNDSDDDKSDADTRPRSLSPVRARSPEQTRTHSEPPRIEITTQTEPVQTLPTQDQTAPPPVFQFTGNSTSDDMQTDETANTPYPEPHSTPTSSSTAPIRLEVVNNRGSRTPHRHNNQRHGSKSNNREFTFTAGTKRKLQFPDFFDISNIGARDGFGSSKRGRMT